MEKDIGKIKKNEITDIVIRIDDYGGKRGLTIREFTTSDRYTGFTKSGTRIPADAFVQFREMINSIDYNEIMNNPIEEKQKISAEPKEEKSKPEKKSKKKVENPEQEEIF